MSLVDVIPRLREDDCSCLDSEWTVTSTISFSPSTSYNYLTAYDSTFRTSFSDGFTLKHSTASQNPTSTTNPLVVPTVAVQVQSPPKHGLSPGAVGGIVIGAFLGLFLFLLLLICCTTIRRDTRSRPVSPEPDVRPRRPKPKPSPLTPTPIPFLFSDSAFQRLRGDVRDPSLIVSIPSWFPVPPIERERFEDRVNQIQLVDDPSSSSESDVDISRTGNLNPPAPPPAPLLPRQQQQRQQRQPLRGQQPQVQQPRAQQPQVQQPQAQPPRAQQSRVQQQQQQQPRSQQQTQGLRSPPQRLMRPLQ